jgi:CDP-diacylglycerol pyrophosphatase
MTILGIPLGWRRGVMGALALVAVLAPIIFLGAATDPNILWKIVHNRCVPDQRHVGSPLPCSRVDLTGGYAILKDIAGHTQYLLIPTARLTGIESPALLAPDGRNYFADAWNQIGFVRARAEEDLPRQDLSLAINSVYGRSQQQLHIHMDCIRADVRNALARHATTIGIAWAAFPEPLVGQSYRAMRITGMSLDGQDPFKLLATGEPGAAADMGRHTLVLAGESFASGTPGFILLDGVADPAQGNMGSGEYLQDHNCAVAKSP